MTLTAPSAWMDECAFELQFYPDSSWTEPRTTVNGNWVAAAVGWQVEASTGIVDPCFYSPLYNQAGTGGHFLNMTQGDTVTVTMTGWQDSPFGENLSVHDLTDHESSSMTLFNQTGDYPLNPAYSTNSWSDSLLWAPDGAPPVSFAFETGAGGNPTVPSNSSTGGCSPGLPPSSPSDLAVPCPSYDPSNWINDTAQPWEIQTPTFTNAAQSQVPSQVMFTQGGGGIDAITDLSNGSCNGRQGSSYCTYPWYSYACGLHAFEFGATDFSGVSADFGLYNEYSTEPATNELGFAYYPPSNHSIPACSQPSDSLTVVGAPDGAVRVLGQLDSASTQLSGLMSGPYPIVAVPDAGWYFEQWQVSGGATVDEPFSPVATLLLTGSGSLTAEFGSSPKSIRVWFNDTPSSGSMALYSGLTATTGIPLATLASGSSLLLAPGVYSVQSYAPPGSQFTWFTSGSAGLSVGAADLSFTWIVINGGGSTASLRATSTAAAERSRAIIDGMGNGRLLFNGTAVPFYSTNDTSFGGYSIPVGTYGLQAIPGPEWTFLGWSRNGSAVQSDFGAWSNVTMEPGTTRLTAEFGANVTVGISPRSGGFVSVNGSAPAGNGTSMWLFPGTYSLDALPLGNSSFQHWAVSNHSALWVLKPNYPLTRLVVNSTGVVTGSFGASAGNSVTFTSSPTGAGAVLFNSYEHYVGTVTNGSVANGSYLISVLSGSAYRFLGWSTTGSINVVAGILVVHGPGTVTARFLPRTYPLTFVSTLPVGISGLLNGTPVESGQTVELAAGTYNLSAVALDNVTFSGWSSVLPIADTSVSSTNITVDQPGTVSAIGVPFAVGELVSSLGVVDVGIPVRFSVIVNGSDPFSYRWSGLPAGCGSASQADLVCTPASAGEFNVSVTVTGISGYAISAGPVSLIVHSRPTILSYGASPSVTDANDTFQLGATAAGGTGTLLYDYEGLPPGCASTDAASLRCTPTGPGTFTIQVSVADSFGVAASSNLTVTVHPDPRITSFTALPSAVTVGVMTVLSMIVIGGTAPLTFQYTGLPNGCSSTNASSVQCIPRSAGMYTITGSARDAVGSTVTAPLALAVNAAPSITSFTVTPSPVTVGTPVDFSVVATGGTGGLYYGYQGLPSNCSGANSSELKCVPSQPGNFTVRVTVSDRFGVSGNRTTKLTVVSAPVPSRNSTSSGFNPVLLVLIVLVAAVVEVGLVYWFTRRKGPGAAS
jgi:hypothetical protein